MARGDGTGPMGMGPMTGRGAGYCAGYSTPGYANQVGFARGFGGGFGRGRGFRGMYYATGVPGWGRYGNIENVYVNAAAYDEKAALGNQAKILESQLKQIKERLSGLDKEDE